MKWIIRLYALVLLGYTGWRTYDFMMLQLPNGETGNLLALLFLFATEVGLALWHEISLRHTTTREQYGIATSLTWLDLAGSLAAGVADMILRQSIGSYAIPALLGQFLIYGLPLVVALNVAGVLLYLGNDSETQLDRAKAELRYEITRQALRELSDNRGAIAESMKKDISKRLKDEVTGRLVKQYLADPSPTHRAALPGSNGKSPLITYNQESELVDPKNQGKGGQA